LFHRPFPTRSIVQLGWGPSITRSGRQIDRSDFWNAADLARKLNEYKDYYNAHRVHRSLGGITPRNALAPPLRRLPRLFVTLGGNIAVVYFGLRSPLD